MSYDEALQRINTLLAELETGEAIPMDEYKTKAKEVKQLLDFCRSKLTSLEEEMKDIVQ